MSQCRIRALVREGHVRAGSSGVLRDTVCTHPAPRCLATLRQSRSNTKTHKRVLLRKHCHGYSRNKGRLQGKKPPSARGKSDRCFHVWAVSLPMRWEPARSERAQLQRGMGGSAHGTTRGLDKPPVLSQGTRCRRTCRGFVAGSGRDRHTDVQGTLG